MSHKKTEITISAVTVVKVTAAVILTKASIDVTAIVIAPVLRRLTAKMQEKTDRMQRASQKFRDENPLN